ncbi:MFS transporter [Micromonospora sp. KC213]|uniref:MFS transporter n=1 Tax=Micromonospora sp. KC213 TaxID=2530378 RepID=UPI00104C8FFA|nr:MFS transporter [Micromonospora sp. KC213]TDC42948.1 MFS transporter [Micromonospora sp. KC213]
MHDTSPDDTGQLATRREWFGLAVLALPTLLLSLDQSVLYLALPHLSAQLGADSTEALWILDIYGFMLAGFLVTMGTLGDRIGRRKLLLVGAAAFGVGTVAAAYSDSVPMLIATRALMGVAGATLMPSTLALISNVFHNAKQRGVAIAVWFSCLMVGGALGPVVGGALLESFWWGSVFLMGAPVMVLLLVLGPVLLPEYRDPNAGRLDLPSVLLSLLAILPVIYGVKEVAKDGWAVGPVLTILAGVVFGVIFVARQRRLTNPLVDIRLFRARPFSAALVILLFGSVTTGGIYLLVSLYLQMVEGLSPLRAGLWLLPSTLAIIVGSMMAPALVSKVRPAYLISAGLAVTAFGYLLLTQVSPTSGLPLLVTGFVLAFLGAGPMGALGTDLVVGSAPPEKAGSAASLSETGNHLGIAIGIAVMGSIGAAVYRSEIATTVPVGVPTEAAAATRESITGAVAAAEQLPAGAADQLLGAAARAFTEGLNAAAFVGAGLFLALAFVAVLALRDARMPEGGAAHGGGGPVAEEDGRTTAAVRSPAAQKPAS